MAVSGFVLAGVRRAMARSIQLQLSCCCPCSSSSLSVHAGLQQMPSWERCISGSKVSHRNPMHGLQKSQSECGFFAGSSSFYNSSSGRDPAAASGSRGGTVSKESWTSVRCMSSSKSKEKPRGSLWRTRSVISKETVLAVHDLKRNKDNSHDLAQVFQTRISRLLKMDMIATLDELQRQGEIELALRLFDVVRKEIWYKPDIFMYRSMMDALSRKRMIPEVEKKFQEVQAEGINPGVVIYRELVGAYVRSHMLPQALEAHAKMVEAGFGDDPLTLRFVEIGKEKEAVRLKQRRKAAERLKAEERQNLEASSEGETLQEDSSLVVK